MRSDRDTVLVGSTKSPLPKQIDIDCGGQKFSWDVPDLKSDAGNAYLVSLVDQAKVDGGKTLPLVDSDSLINAKKEIEAGGQGLDRLAEELLKAANSTRPVNWRRGPAPQSERHAGAGRQGRRGKEGGR